MSESIQEDVVTKICVAQIKQIITVVGQAFFLYEFSIVCCSGVVRRDLCRLHVAVKNLVVVNGGVAGNELVVSITTEHVLGTSEVASIEDIVS